MRRNWSVTTSAFALSRSGVCPPRWRLTNGCGSGCPARRRGGALVVAPMIFCMIRLAGALERARGVRPHTGATSDSPRAAPVHLRGCPWRATRVPAPQHVFSRSAQSSAKPITVPKPPLISCRRRMSTTRSSGVPLPMMTLAAPIDEGGLVHRLVGRSIGHRARPHQGPRHCTRCASASGQLRGPGAALLPRGSRRCAPAHLHAPVAPIDHLAMPLAAASSAQLHCRRQGEQAPPWSSIRSTGRRRSHTCRPASMPDGADLRGGDGEGHVLLRREQLQSRIAQREPVAFLRDPLAGEQRRLITPIALVWQSRCTIGSMPSMGVWRADPWSPSRRSPARPTCGRAGPSAGRR